MTDVESDLTLLQFPDTPGLLGCYLCGAAFPGGAYIVAADVAGRAPCCGRCVGEVGAPELAACVEALNILAATAGDLTPPRALSVVGAMVQLIAALYGPTLALMGVPTRFIDLIERNQG